ncbi:MAG: hypothetical protein JWO03_2996 [Bacteroidetes bacterium]|nr:hypothetical protein [Bacteroidota bacterium]
MTKGYPRRRKSETSFYSKFQVVLRNTWNNWGNNFRGRVGNAFVLASAL